MSANGEGSCKALSFRMLGIGTLLGVPSILILGRSNSFFMEILGPLSSSERLPNSSLSLLSACRYTTSHCPQLPAS